MFTKDFPLFWDLFQLHQYGTAENSHSRFWSFRLLLCLPASLMSVEQSQQWGIFRKLPLQGQNIHLLCQVHGALPWIPFSLWSGWFSFKGPSVFFTSSSSYIPITVCNCTYSCLLVDISSGIEILVTTSTNDSTLLSVCWQQPFLENGYMNFWYP